MIIELCICVCLYVYASSHALCLSFVISALISSVHEHGAVCPAVYGFGRVLFAGVRDGDVTEWYHSKGCNNGPLWAMKDVVTEAELPSA